MAVKDDFMEMPRWQKVLIFGGIVLVLAVVWYFALLAPTQEKIGAVQREIRRIDNEIAAQERAKLAKRKLETQIKALRDELKILSAKLPEEKEIPALLSSVTEMGRVSGLAFSLFKKEREKRRDFYTEIPVQIQVAGGYHQVARFLNTIGDMDRIIHVSDLKMDKYRSENGAGKVDTSFKATTYKYESEPLPKPAKGKKGKRGR